MDESIRLMMHFAERTGLTSAGPQQRYLWTDAFGVCNFLGIARATGEGRYSELALSLVERVHHTLGKHRTDDWRTGWISGLGEKEGESHPTRGGLRIGKKLPERRPGKALDDQLEWDRDGQYFHYLTKWMHALDQLSRFTRKPQFNLWARELAEAAYAAFSYTPSAGTQPRLMWKMSIDLSRPLVPSMGQLDPLDGLVTCTELQTTARELAGRLDEPTLKREVAGFASMIEHGSWATTDMLGVGGLLIDACRIDQLMERGAFQNDDLFRRVLAAALDGLEHSTLQEQLQQPALRRLAFRELGLAIGLHAIELMERDVRQGPPPSSAIQGLLRALRRYRSLASAVESYWLNPDNRQAKTWSDHRDINEVMLATSLVPEGCLILRR
jgi:hypothetical protein